VSDHAELADFAAELNDRFGPPPPPTEQMLSLASLRIAAHRWGIRAIHLEDGYAVFRYTSPQAIRELAATGRDDLRIVDGHSAYLPLKGGDGNPEVVLRQVKSLLQSN
jgi:transcription-repair coupling factor (superfamily II helicase)